MKVGITYLYTILRYGYPPNPKDDFKALAEIHKMGFRFMEMEGLGPRHTAGIWKMRADLKKCLQDNDVTVINFCGVDPDLVSMDVKKRRIAYDRFKQKAELGSYLGTTNLLVASYPPPAKYIGKKPYMLNKKYSFADKPRILIPPGFSWKKVWDVIVESCQVTADIAAQHRRTLLMEPRVGDVICSADSMLRLIADVGRRNFKANFDTAHLSAQRENVALALMKLKGQFATVHIADNDPVAAEHLPVGEGKIDWQEFFRVLKMLRFDGYMGLDLGPSKTLMDDCKRSLKYIQGVAKEQKVQIEW